MFIIEKLDVKDEILAGEELYTIKDSTGRVVFENVKIDLVTYLVQNGTELNKVLFDKIDKNFEKINYYYKTGEDIRKFIIDGEYQGRVDGIISGTERARMKRIDDLEAEIESLKERVAKLEA